MHHNILRLVRCTHPTSCATRLVDLISSQPLPDPTSPENLESATGRGIVVMRNYMDRVEFSEKGNSVLLEASRNEDQKDD